MEYNITSLYCERKNSENKYKFKPFNKNAKIIINVGHKDINFSFYKKNIEKVIITQNGNIINESRDDFKYNFNSVDKVTIEFVGLQDEAVIYLYDFKTSDIKHDYKISIITLVRNTNDLLKDSVQSLISQTNDKWENIIINDGSKNKIFIEDILLPEQTNKYKSKFKIINLNNWNGLIKCHKLGIIHAKYDIVGILDSDDKLEPDAINSVLEVYNYNKENVSVYTNFNLCDSKFEILSKGWGSHTFGTNLLNKRRGNHFRTFPRKYYFLTKGYDDDLIFGAEDQDILFKIEKFCHPIYLDKYLYNYRTGLSNGTISSLKKTAKYSYYLSILKNIFDRYGNLDFYIEIYSNINIDEKNKLSNYLKLNELYPKLIKYKNIKFNIELKSNNIRISTLDSGDNITEYINKYIKNIDNSKHKVNIKYDYLESKFNIVNNSFDLEKFRLIHPNTYFDNIYIINLKKDIEKRERIKRIFDKYNIKCEFIEAVYGKEVPNIDLYKKPNTKLTSVGQYGYSLSMIKILSDAIEKNYKKILVCDDDIILKKNFLYEFDKNIKKIPYDWKVLFLGLSGPWSFHEKIFLYSHDLNQNYTTNLVGCDGSFCVGYDSTMFKKIIEITNNFIYPYDTQLIRYLNENLDIDKYAFYPHLVIADTVKKSDIVNYQEEMDLIKNIERNHFRFMINLQEYELDTMQSNKYKELEII
jgi:GR25 family glycosyltransferase involved in LPS biosynthesis/glycosyltransferase involved in cell wall biosynthesis